MSTTESGLPQTGSAVGGVEFEFNDQQNTVFHDLARSMRFVGTFLLVLGILTVVVGLVLVIGVGNLGDAAGSIGYLAQGLIYFLIGRWTRNASTDVNRVATTTGSDIHHLMLAMGELKRVFGLQRALLMIILGLAILLFVAMVVIGMVHH